MFIIWHLVCLLSGNENWYHWEMKWTIQTREIKYKLNRSGLFTHTSQIIKGLHLRFANHPLALLWAKTVTYNPEEYKDN